MRKDRVTIICKWCKKPFEVKKYRALTAKFCSQSCLAKHHYPSYLACGFTMRGRIPHNKIYQNKNERRRAAQRKHLNTLKGKLSQYVGNSIRQSLAAHKNKKGVHWESLVGYSAHNLKNHLEKQFTEGMSWENYGRYGWHIDHIIPISVFNFNGPHDIDFQRCWALDNLQPLWAHDNLTKHARLAVAVTVAERMVDQ